MQHNPKFGVYPACLTCGRPMPKPLCQHLDCPASPYNTADLDPHTGMCLAVASLAGCGMLLAFGLAVLASQFNGN